MHRPDELSPVNTPIRDRHGTELDEMSAIITLSNDTLLWSLSVNSEIWMRSLSLARSDMLLCATAVQTLCKWKRS